MVTTVGLAYLVGGTVLFFFWVYGIVSFALDLKNVVLPGVRGLLAQRREAAARAADEEARDEREQQLY